MAPGAGQSGLWLAMKRASLADDDGAMPSAQLRARLKQRAKLARRAERATALALGLPPPDPPTDKGGRPTLADNVVKPATLNGASASLKRRLP
jgi:hypothetical protein